MLELLTCELCGHSDLDVKIGLAWYLDSMPSEAIQAIARCLNVDACRSRVAIRRESWPLRISGEDVAA